MKTLIRGAKLLDKDGERTGSILIDNGKIRRVYKPGARIRAKYDEVIDADGLTVMPGMIDTHCHLRDPGLTWKEDLHTGLRAAAKGGFTTVFPMANTNPVTDSKEKLEDINRRAREVGLTEVRQVCALTEDFGPDKCVDFESTRPLTRAYSNDGKNVDNVDRMIEGLEASTEYDFILMCHEQPETKTVLRDIDLLREHGGHLHICHISKKDTLDAIRAAKDEGLDITCEVTPHHVYASGIEYRVHPPFRTWNDRRALIEGLRDGTIDTFGTDHAPHSDEDKKNGSPGLINFETAFAMYRTVFDKNNIPMERFSEMASFTPAKRLGMKAGLIKDGYPADLIFVDLDQEWRVEPKEFESKSRNTPFAGKWLKGQVVRTMKDGQIIYDRDDEEKFHPIPTDPETSEKTEDAAKAGV